MRIYFLAAHRSRPMARISIYVPDDLKSQMDGIERINWSEIARPAFEQAVATFEHQKGQTMDTAIERLRASKEAQSQNDFFAGQQDGRVWAQDTADYAELRRLSRIEFPGGDYRSAINALKKAIDPKDEMTIAEVLENCFGEAEDVEDEYVAGFI